MSVPAISVWLDSAMNFGKIEQPDSERKRWVTGDIFGGDIPADAGALLAGGADFLTRAFHSSGALGEDNRVSGIVDAREFFGGGTGKKLLLTVTYEVPGDALPEQLFVKFSRNFDNELWDRGRFMMISEAHFAVLSRSPDFPVTVPACLFADVEAESGTGLLVTRCISYGSNGVEPHYPKCMDYNLREPLAHYQAILRGLAALSGAHRGGRLSPDFDTRFPYQRRQASAMFALHAPVEKLLQRAHRMFDFVERYPQLFPENLRGPAFRQQFIRDIPQVVAAQERIRDILFGNPDMIAFAHWNGNIDNCWFWRDTGGNLQCGFMDWANAGQISVAQSINGALSGAEPFIWNGHLDELLALYIADYARQGGPQLALDELRQHVLLIVAIAGVGYSMGAPVALEREIEDLASMQSNRDECLRNRENARVQLHMMTKMLNVWQTRQLGDLIRQL